jgi:antitoxin (DNA-binding transcriptional repressor) of toxin-antitoxin stability system
VPAAGLDPTSNNLAQRTRSPCVLCEASAPYKSTRVTKTPQRGEKTRNLFPHNSRQNQKTITFTPEQNKKIYMKTLQSEEVKTQLASVLKEAEAGNEVAIVDKMQTNAVIVPYSKWKNGQKRQLGSLEGRMSVSFRDDFKMTDEELVNL